MLGDSAVRVLESQTHTSDSPCLGNKKSSYLHITNGGSLNSI